MNIYLLMFFIIWIGGWWLNVRISKFETFNLAKFIVPSLFGVVFLFMWELIVIGLSINPVLLPAPTAIASKFSSSLDILWIDFVQTLVKGALSGYILGCGSAFLTAIAIDKFNFLKRGLLPLGNFISALPIVGMAPIFVMWFGFDWQSKCAIVIVMVYFPMLVNSVQGLELIDPSRQDLMRTYNASYTQTLLKLRLPSALPFIFNGLKPKQSLSNISSITTCAAFPFTINASTHFFNSAPLCPSLHPLTGGCSFGHLHAVCNHTNCRWYALARILCL